MALHSKPLCLSLPMALLAAAFLLGTAVFSAQAAPAEWQDDLQPIAAAEWSRERAAHLLERAGFGGTQKDVEKLAAMSPRSAVQSLLRYQTTANPLPSFEPSGVHDVGLEPFSPSRPAATDQARDTGEALGVKVKPGGNRRMQQVADRFLYWLRASRLETHRLAYWWAHRMLTTQRPLEEKMTLFWHSHFATSEEKVRDYRKMQQQNELFRTHATGNFRTLMIAVAQDPAMLAYLDAAANVKGEPNENFAREIMELFTMGVGNYTEQDIREAARAFTGWNYAGLKFVVNPDQHDNAAKTVLGRQGNFDGAQVIDILLAQPVTAEFMAAKLYRYFVREELSAPLKVRLGELLRASNYEVAPFLEALFNSRDFYSDASVATRIKPPVELVISTYRKMGLKEVPGIPDFNDLTESLGQKLMFPPNVAGWANGQSWITPGLLFARGNFVYDAVFPPIDFVPTDRVPNQLYQILSVADKLAAGQDITSATKPEGKTGASAAMPMSMQADRDEDFNTRLASYHAWRKAIEKVRPIARTTAQLDVSAMVRAADCKTAQAAVDYLLARFLSVPIPNDTRQKVSALLKVDLGTDDLTQADSYMEDALRNALHVILSLPAYQLG